MLIGALIAFPLGLLTGHTKRGGLVVTSLANVARALPTLGLVVLLVVVLGVKSGAVMIPLVALTVPPILLNTYEGVRNVDPQLTDAAKGMGLRPWQVLWRAEVPAALPLILTGFQFAAVNAVANTAIAAYSSFGGTGTVRDRRPGHDRLRHGGRGRDSDRDRGDPEPRHLRRVAQVAGIAGVEADETDCLARRPRSRTPARPAPDTP